MYDLGDTVSLAVDVLDADGVATVATTVTLTVTLPDATTVAPTVTSPTPGRYVADYVPTSVGRHVARWVSLGPSTAFSDAFDVRPANPNYIISLSDAKAHLNKVTDESDEEIRSWLEVTTEIVDELAGRVTARRTVTETHTIYGCGYTDRLALTWAPVLSLTSVTAVGPTSVVWSVGNLDVDPRSGMVQVLSGPLLSGTVRIVYVAGSESIPARYTGAARIILRHLWESQRASIGAGKRGRSGMVDETMQLVAGYAVPRAAAELIGPRGPLVA